MAGKLDLYVTHKAEYAAPRKPALVRVGKAHYLAIEGAGSPGSDAFAAAIGALYGVAFTIKMTRKFAGKQDYAVCKLEAQWWSDSAEEFASAPKTSWRWRLMIRTPDFVAARDVHDAVDVLLERKKGAEVKDVTRVSITEGACVQVLHVGPYEDEPESIRQMQAFAASKGLRVSGRHHEIYLSDPRRVAPARLRTILRQPVSR